MQLYNLLVANFAEVAEPYIYEFINSLSGERDMIAHCDDINQENALSLLVKNYVKAQLKSVDDEEVVAEDIVAPEHHVVAEPPTTEGGQPGPLSLGKTKKDKERALKDGELHDHLTLIQTDMATKLHRRAHAKKFKAKAWREYKTDQIREADSDQMALLACSLAKFRHEDKFSLKRHNRFCNTGGNAHATNSNSCGPVNLSGHRPPSASATYNSCVMPMQIRSRFQKKQPATVVRNSHSNTNHNNGGGMSGGKGVGGGAPTTHITFTAKK